MKRFFDENGDLHFGGDDDSNEEGPSHIDAFINVEQDIASMLELDLMEMEQRAKLLEQAVALASKDFWWYFRKPTTKLRRIERIFRRLEGLIYDDEPKKK